MSRIAVVGVGAIGGTVAAHLASSGAHELVLCVRDVFDELVVETPLGELRASLRTVTRPSEVGPVDWVLLATKAHQTAGARAWLEALAGPGVPVAVLQNGVEHEARVRPFVGAATILPVIASGSAARLAPGHLRQRTAARLTVRDDAVGARFRELGEGTALTVDCTADFVTAAWTKLCVNAAGGAITALTGQSMGVIHRPGMAELARGLILECVRVGRAEGARLDDSLADELVAAMKSGSPDASPSILQDLRAERPLEYDARNGAVARIGARHGLETPLNAMATTVLAALSARFESP